MNSQAPAQQQLREFAFGQSEILVVSTAFLIALPQTIFLVAFER